MNWKHTRATNFPIQGMQPPTQGFSNRDHLWNPMGYALYPGRDDWEAERLADALEGRAEKFSLSNPRVYHYLSRLRCDELRMTLRVCLDIGLLERHVEYVDPETGNMVWKLVYREKGGEGE